MGEPCPKNLEGQSFRAPAFLQDHCTGERRVVADFLGGGFSSTVLPQQRPQELPEFPNPDDVAFRIIKAFNEPDKYGEWFYRNMHPDARLSYGGRNTV